MSSARQKLAGALGLAVAATGLSFVAPPAAQADPVNIRLLNINDFHGRIDANTTKFATTVEQERAEAGAGNTLLLSAGDNIGASLFASSYFKDEPTIDVLNALGLATSSVGNHEFDGGFADLTGRVADSADWDYLGANVYQKGTQTPVLPEYRTFNIGGVTVGVIGVVTAETPSLVSPAGVATLDFGDPVAAVNRVAAKLSDCNLGNGEADVIIAEFHDGAGAGTPDGATLAEEVAGGGTFGRMVTETSAAVDVIYTGHTHKQYAWDAPVPGSPGKTRPILQTGSYGEFVGEVDLTVNDSGAVTAYRQENVARAATENLSFPRVNEVKQITDAALAQAAVVGNQPIGRITADITTAHRSPTARDDRSAESTLGGLVANALRDGLSDIAKPDLGITNPGGLRAELRYAGDTSSNPANTDGVVTFAEANAVLPFNNTVATVDLTGAQLEAVLEQQWQRNAAGAIPSDRPYLQLGLSDNVVVTADATRPEGSRITSVSIDGARLDRTATYTVGTLSFLAAGGDNFRAFREGRMVDTGLLDAQLWRDYLAANSPISPDFARQQVFESGLPMTVAPGQSFTATLGPDYPTTTHPNTGETLDLTSLGSPANTTVSISGIKADGTVIPAGSAPVTNGTAQVTVTVPPALTDGVLRLVAQPSGTTVTIPVGGAALAATDRNVTAPRGAAPASAPTPASARVVPTSEAASLFPPCAEPKDVVVTTTKAKGKKGLVTIHLAANGKPLTGTLLVQVKNKVVTVSLTKGVGTFKLGKKVVRSAKKGKLKAKLVFTGNDDVNPFATKTTIKVKKKFRKK